MFIIHLVGFDFHKHCIVQMRFSLHILMKIYICFIHKKNNEEKNLKFMMINVQQCNVSENRASYFIHLLIKFFINIMMDNINSWLFCPSQLEQEKMTYSHCVGYDDDDDNDDNDCFRLKLAIHLCPSDATQSKNVFSSHYLFTCRWKTTTKVRCSST